MRRICILLSMLPVGIMAQNYAEIQTGLKNFFYGSADVADMDNDGKPDVVINGALDIDGDGQADVSYNEIYKNSGTSLMPYANAGSDANHLGDIKFIDFDNDGLLDVISTGLSYMDVVNYKHYRFKNTGNGLVKEAEFPGKIYGSVEVFDFDHDGKQDYVINGTQYVEGTGFINDLDYYRNTGNSFELTRSWMEGTQNGSFKMVDLNNDHLLDLVILGTNTGSAPLFKVYLNEGGTLELSQDFNAMSSGKLDFADFNADGYQDIVVSGTDQNNEPYFAVLMNDGTGHLTAQEISSQEIADASISVGDLNSDGYYDFIISGNDEDNNAVVKTFLFNPSNQEFIENIPTGLHYLGGTGFINLLDFDNDNRLDVLLAGFDWADPDYPSLTKIFRNTSQEVNRKPTPPANLNLTKNGNRFQFSWNGATDDKTPVNALRYEIKVGSAPGAADIARYTVTTPSWFLDLDPSVQNVYWSVRSIDASKTYSDPSAEGTLAVREAKTGNKVSVYPNPASDKVFIKGEKVSEAEMYSMDGKKLNITLEQDQTISVSHLPKGTYILQLKIKNEITTQKLIIK